MVITRGKRQLATIISTEVYGKSFEQILAEKEAEKEAQKEVDRLHTILSMLKNNFTPQQIADIFGYDLDNVINIAKKNTAD